MSWDELFMAAPEFCLKCEGSTQDDWNDKNWRWDRKDFPLCIRCSGEGLEPIPWGELA